MLDINLLRHEPEKVKAALAKRNFVADLDAFLTMDEQYRALLYKMEELKAERNTRSSQVGKLKSQGKDAAPLLASLKELSAQIKQSEAEVAALKDEIDTFMLGLPNLPADGVVAGGKENNQVQAYFGEKPEFDFTPQDHVSLAEALGLINYERGAKLSGAGFWVYYGQGALLERALLNFFMDQHSKDGYQMILPPHILNYACGRSAGQFPKFTEDVFQLRLQGKEEDEAGQGFNRFLLPTSETALITLFKDEILPEAALPQKLFAYTPCYRREAGSYRADERGMIRGHQFNKVEMFQFTTPDQEPVAFRELIQKACDLVTALGLHFRLVKLAAGDVSASMHETWDIEIYIPSMGGYKEVSSVSTAGDYQARRGNIRYRREADDKVEFVSTLNGSGLATSRVFPAILEQNQLPDGRVKIPDVLVPYMQGQTYLEPNHSPIW